MSWLFWKAREPQQARRQPDIELDESQVALPTPGAPTITYVCNTYRCPAKGTRITLELAAQGGFAIGNMPPICLICGKNGTKDSTAGIGHL